MANPEIYNSIEEPLEVNEAELTEDDLSVESPPDPAVDRAAALMIKASDRINEITEEDIEFLKKGLPSGNNELTYYCSEALIRLFESVRAPIGQKALDILVENGLDISSLCCHNVAAGIMRPALLDADNFSDEIKERLILPARQTIEWGLHNLHSLGPVSNAIGIVLNDSSHISGESRRWLIELVGENAAVFGAGLENAFKPQDSSKETKEVYQKSIFNACAETLAAGLSHEDCAEEVRVVIENFINRFGLNGNEVFQRWIDSCSRAWFEIKDENGIPHTISQFAEIVKDNLETMLEIEKRREGAIKALNRRFGINCFGRYNPGILIEQFDDMANTKKRYVAAFYPANDHNGAFYLQRGILSGLSERLGARGIALRISECRDKLQIYHRLHNFNGYYGNEGKNKILGAVIAGHGTSDSIQFGPWRTRETLALDDFPESAKKSSDRITSFDLFSFEADDRADRAHKTVADYFIENPSVVLISCSTGKKGGIGQVMSKQYGAAVVSPTVPTNLKEIYVDDRDDGGIQMRAVYSDADQSTYIKGIPSE